ncbi:tRNA-uridine aminocarboxypropyltransferase [Prosthecomicrobium sp. N25]|uniref:tRNA-uridine aminocarboxypropyltransferase n=1 Tax=Prosthecomicrobium sp. N25 TaxID=3129254 RepID=UPI00307844AF
MTPTETTPRPADPECPRCLKPLPLCVCDAVEVIDNRVEVLVLQHPQEQDKLLGTARVAVGHLARAAFRIGLSWASLAKAVGHEAPTKRWAVLHLGSVEPSAMPAGRDLVVVDAKGRPVADQDAALADIEGVIAFDGSWSQAKTLWWRNPWVLKAKRLVILPRQPSLYGRLRKEPRREGLSTLEAIAFVLSRLEGRPEIETRMLSTFRRMLQRFRDSDYAVKPGRKAPPSAPPAPEEPAG